MVIQVLQSLLCQLLHRHFLCQGLVHSLEEVMAVGRDTNDTSADTLAQEQHTKEEEERKEEAADRQAGPPEKPSS